LKHAARALTLALIVGLLAAAPVAASATASGPGTAVATPDFASAAALSSAKVVIIVGATHSETSHYRDIADSAYAEAVKWSSNVVKVYSPNATWSAVKSAAQGASVVIYLGHGNGWPSPYTYDPSFTTKDGFGLNASAGNGDYNNKYYGEPSIATLSLAPNSVVLLNHLCYASGNSEPGNADPTLSTAMQRVDNYGSAFLRAGARAVIAEGHGSINGMIRDLFSTHQTVLDLWRGQSDYHGHELSFQSSRSSGYSAYMDPDSPSSGYYRSLVGNPDLRTEDVTGVPYTPTDTTPGTLQSPGAATVIGGADLYWDEGLSSPKGSSLDAGAAVRVEDLATQGAAVPGSPTAAYVRELDGSPSGWTSTGLLAPQDSAGPQLWGVDGNRTVSPNGDGIADTLALTLRFSEDVSWSVQVRDGWNVKWQVQGSGDQPSVAWDMLVGGSKLPDGDYTLAIHAEDEWGNDALDTHVGLTVDSAAVFRIAGSDRFSTAAAISEASFEPGVPVAYIATGLNFPDALAGAAVAGSQGAPILLVMPNSIPAATATELKRLKPGKIVILGGTGAVSDLVRSQLRAYAGD
jgi:Cell wall binding domain 2 (CWB2)